MGSSVSIKRRDFLVGVGLGSVGLAFGFHVDALSAVGPSANAPGLKMAWVHIAPDDKITIMAPVDEMGQGSSTALAVIFAEELDADWNKVSVEFSPPDDKLYGNPTWWTYGIMLTGASTAMSGFYQALRLYGAQARRVLLDAAAERLRVPVGELTTGPSVVLHERSGKRLTYGEIAAFAQAPAALPSVSAMDLKDPATFRIIGQQTPRWDIPSKTNGSAKYSIDVRLPDMVYATVVRAPVLGATPVSVNEAAVSKLPGVLKVLRLPPDRVAIVARTYEQALAAERSLAIQWGKAPADGLDSERALDEHAAVAHDLSKAGFPAHKRGDISAAFSSAAKVYEGEYRTEFVYHAQLEPLNSISWVKDGGKSVEVWAGTQTPTHLVRSVSVALRIPPENVTLHRHLLGGGFGRRAAQDHDWAVDSALLSKEMGKPVKVIWSRESDVRFGRFKPLTAEYIRVSEDSAGQLTAWHYRLASDEALSMSDPLRYERGKEIPVIASAGIETSYAFPNVLAEVVRQRLNLRISPVRGVGATINLFAIESFLDEIAHAKGLDPLQFRLDLLQQLPAAQDTLRAVAAMSGWDKGNKTNCGISFSSKGDAYLATIVRIDVDRSTGVIRVPEIWVAADVGIPIQPRNLDAQMLGAALHALSNLLKERITFKNGAVQESNYYDYPVLRMSEAPEVHTHIMPSKRDPQGIGDVAGLGVAPAVGNAFFSITGIRLRQTPFLPDRVLAALKV